ncbi:MAG: hypothetical protein LBJ93_00700, partial [Clostridiales bacterium]|nr:hypothetical protein [Clostridiales bacterium]
MQLKEINKRFIFQTHSGIVLAFEFIVGSRADRFLIAGDNTCQTNVQIKDSITNISSCLDFFCSNQADLKLTQEKRDSIVFFHNFMQRINSTHSSFTRQDILDKVSPGTDLVTINFSGYRDYDMMGVDIHHIPLYKRLCQRVEFPIRLFPGVSERTEQSRQLSSSEIKIIEIFKSSFGNLTLKTVVDSVPDVRRNASAAESLARRTAIASEKDKYIYLHACHACVSAIGLHILNEDESKRELFLIGVKNYINSCDPDKENFTELLEELNDLKESSTKDENALKIVMRYWIRRLLEKTKIDETIIDHIIPTAIIIMGELNSPAKEHVTQSTVYAFSNSYARYGFYPDNGQGHSYNASFCLPLSTWLTALFNLQSFEFRKEDFDEHIAQIIDFEKDFGSTKLNRNLGVEISRLELADARVALINSFSTATDTRKPIERLEDKLKDPDRENHMGYYLDFMRSCTDIEDIKIVSETHSEDFLIFKLPLHFKNDLILSSMVWLSDILNNAADDSLVSDFLLKFYKLLRTEHFLVLVRKVISQLESKKEINEIYDRFTDVFDSNFILSAMSTLRYFDDAHQNFVFEKCLRERSDFLEIISQSPQLVQSIRVSKLNSELKIKFFEIPGILLRLYISELKKNIELFSKLNIEVISTIFYNRFEEMLREGLFDDESSLSKFPLARLIKHNKEVVIFTVFDFMEVFLDSDINTVDQFTLQCYAERVEVVFDYWPEVCDFLNSYYETRKNFKDYFALLTKSVFCLSFCRSEKKRRLKTRETCHNISRHIFDDYEPSVPPTRSSTNVEILHTNVEKLTQFFEYVLELKDFEDIEKSRSYFLDFYNYLFRDKIMISILANKMGTIYICLGPLFSVRFVNLLLLRMDNLGKFDSTPVQGEKVRQVRKTRVIATNFGPGERKKLITHFVPFFKIVVKEILKFPAHYENVLIRLISRFSGISPSIEDIQSTVNVSDIEPGLINCLISSQPIFCYSDIPHISDATRDFFLSIDPNKISEILIFKYMLGLYENCERDNKLVDFYIYLKQLKILTLELCKKFINEFANPAYIESFIIGDQNIDVIEFMLKNRTICSLLSQGQIRSIKQFTPSIIRSLLSSVKLSMISALDISKIVLQDLEDELISGLIQTKYESDGKEVPGIQFMTKGQIEQVCLKLNALTTQESFTFFFSLVKKYGIEYSNFNLVNLNPFPLSTLLRKLTLEKKIPELSRKQMRDIFFSVKELKNRVVNTAINKLMTNESFVSAITNDRYTVKTIELQEFSRFTLEDLANFSRFLLAMIVKISSDKKIELKIDVVKFMISRDILPLEFLRHLASLVDGNVENVERYLGIECALAILSSNQLLEFDEDIIVDFIFHI